MLSRQARIAAMGTRGPAPVRAAERRRTPEPGTRAIEEIGPEQTRDLPFEVDLAPEPPAAVEEWHPIALELWESLQRDPSRMWTGPAAWAASLAMCENLSRMLSPRIAATTMNTETGAVEVIREAIPFNGAETAGFLKWMSMAGIYEPDRLRMQKEITFYPVGEQASAPVFDIVRDRTAALGGDTA